MKRAYLDCSSGVAGDMLLAAMLDAGAPEERLRGELRKIPLGDYDFRVSRVMRAGLAGLHVEIAAPGKQPERHLAEIETLIAKSALATGVKERAVKVFRRLAEAEGKLHAKPAAQVHFHEVGAVDAILDVVGACVGLELLEVSKLTASPLNVGGGGAGGERVKAAHGSLPIPVPATAELLQGIPIYSSGVEAELVTPTGAAIVSTLAERFGPLPPMQVERIGYGAGSRDIAGHPNLLRLLVGEPVDVAVSGTGIPRADATSNGVVSVIEANVDDMSPQLYGYLVERALAAGALDVTCSAIQMKKNRPGFEVSILCAPDRADALAELVFSETTTIGLRIYEARRKVLDREWVSVETAYGAVRVKVARRDGRVVNAAPEYEDCQRLASEKGVPLKDVILAAQLAYAQKA